MSFTWPGLANTAQVTQWEIVAILLSPIKMMEKIHTPDVTVNHILKNGRGVVRTGATGAMAPVDFLNMYFGTRRFKTKRLRNHQEDYLFM